MKIVSYEDLEAACLAEVPSLYDIVPGVAHFTNSKWNGLIHEASGVEASWVVIRGAVTGQELVRGLDVAGLQVRGIIREICRQIREATGNAGEVHWLRTMEACDLDGSIMQRAWECDAWTFMLRAYFAVPGRPVYRNRGEGEAVPLMRFNPCSQCGAPDLGAVVDEPLHSLPPLDASKACEACTAEAMRVPEMRAHDPIEPNRMVTSRETIERIKAELAGEG